MKKILANRCFVLLQCSGDYEDYREVSIVASLDLQKVKDVEAKREKDDAEYDTCAEIINQFADEYLADNPSPKSEPLIQRKPWPSGIGKAAITDEMREERKEIDRQNEQIIRCNQALRDVYDEKRIEVTTAWLNKTFSKRIAKRFNMAKKYRFYREKRNYRIEEIELLI